MVSVPAPSSTTSEAILADHFGCWKMCRMPRRSPSPSSPTFPMNRMGARFGNGRGVHRARDGNQRGDSRRIVGNPGTVELVAIAAHRNFRAGRKHRVQMRAQCNVRSIRVAARADAEYVADLVLMDIGERQLSETVSSSHSLRAASPHGGAAMDVTWSCRSSSWRA